MWLSDLIKRKLKAASDARLERDVAQAACEERLACLKERTKQANLRTAEIQKEIDAIKARAPTKVMSTLDIIHSAMPGPDRDLLPPATAQAMAAAANRMMAAMQHNGLPGRIGSCGPVGLSGSLMFAGNLIQDGGYGIVNNPDYGKAGIYAGPQDRVIGQFPSEQPAVVPHLLASMTLPEIDGFIAAIEREMEGGASDEATRRMLEHAMNRRNAVKGIHVDVGTGDQTAVFFRRLGKP